MKTALLLLENTASAFLIVFLAVLGDPAHKKHQGWRDYQGGC